MFTFIYALGYALNKFPDILVPVNEISEIQYKKT